MDARRGPAPLPHHRTPPRPPRASRLGCSSAGPPTTRSSARSTSARLDDEYVFYDGPPFANGLPHYGHLLTGFVKDVVPRYQTMQGRRVDRRFGWDCHGLPAEIEAEKELGRLGPQADHRLRHRAVQRPLPPVGPALHRRVGAVRHPPGPVGRLRARLQDHGHLLHGERHLGVQAAVGQGAAVPGPSGHALLVGGRDTAVELRDPTRRRHPSPPGPGHHRAVPARARAGRRGAAVAAGVDDHAVDAAVQPGGRRRARHRVRRGRAGRRALRAGRGHPGRLRRPTGRRPPGRHHPRLGARRTPLSAPVRLLHVGPGRVPGPRGRLGRHHRGHRRRAPRPRLRRGRPEGLRGQRHPTRGAGRRRRGVHRRGPGLGRASTCSTPTPRSSAG